jgi:hypothetical protein
MHFEMQYGTVGLGACPGAKPLDHSAGGYAQGNWQGVIDPGMTVAFRIKLCCSARRGCPQGVHSIVSA